ncbi:MAG: butyrate kinase, partial [Erysipelotrichaceae bacterium]|nr:butyrate kinase [Erysipelotrichaceae bacterium]
MNSYKVLVINPGSTSTKLALYENNHCITSTNVFHDSSVLMKFPHINDQLLYRLHVIQEFIESNQINCSDLDAVMARGGGCVSVESGIYEVNRKMLADTKKAKGNLYHVSMLGVQLGAECQKMYGGRLLTMDPPVVDEYQDLARITGISGVYRTAISHALNLKATIKDHCHRVGKDYEKTNWIVCHIDGGISITAHRRGRMIDGNDAGGGQGPFTPTRMGSMAVTDLLRLLKEKSLEEIQNDCYESGGLSS